MCFLEPRDLRRALLSFDRGTARRGREYFDAGRVISAEITGDGSYRFLVRGSLPEGYTVEINLGKAGWTSDCSCPVEFECKHVYASLLFLEKHGDSRLAEPTPNDRPNRRSGFFELVPKKSNLSEKNADFMKGLESLYQAHQRGDTIDGFRLQAVFPSWKMSSPWLAVRIAPESELTRLQFWHFVVAAATEHKVAVPKIFGESNEIAPSLALIQKWHDQLLREEWEEAYRQHPPMLQDREESDYRWLFENNQLGLEIRRWNETSFRKIRSEELQWLRNNYRVATNAVCPDAVPLVTEHLQFEYSYSQKINITVQSATRLNALLRIREIQNRLVFPRERPLELCGDPVSWRMDRSPEKPGWYRFQLWQESGPVEGSIKIFPGSDCFYLRDNVLLKGSPPPFPIKTIDSPTVVEIPKLVVESPVALPSVLAACHELDPALEQKIRRVTLKPIIWAETRFMPGTQNPALYFSPQLIDPQTGQPVAFYGELGWGQLDRKIVQNGEEIVVYSLPDLTHVHSALAKLPSTFDRVIKAWRVKHPKSSLQTFAEWSQQLPSEVALEVSSELSGLREPPAELSLTLDLVDSGNDWFDLRLALPRSEIDLTPEELQLLLQARGQTVRLESRAQRQVRLNTADSLLQTLDEIGLTPDDLADDGERLHVIHLRNLLNAGLLPDRLRSRLESRLEKIQTQVRPETPAHIQAGLRPYQVDGFHFLAYLAENDFGGILADDMGLGKTLQALVWLAWLDAKRTSEDKAPSLIVCPKSVVDNWVSESSRFYRSLEIHARDGTRWVNVPPRSALVINYTQLRLQRDDLVRIPWQAVIFDEGQYLKNPSSQTAQAASALKARHKILLTGTPIENRLLDLWSLLHTVMPGSLGSKASFARRFQEKTDPTSRQRLARRVKPFLLRRTKEEVAPELPPRIEEDIRCQMEGVQEKLYRAELKLARQHLLKLKDDEQLSRERFNILTSLLRLRQICCHPALVDPEKRGSSSAKVDALGELLDPLIAEGNKILVFSQFVEMLKLIEARLKEIGAPIHVLTGETKGRAKVIEEFGNEPGAAVFLLSLKAGGAGLNLASASYVVLFDPWWNPAVENQAIDRTHRIGQNKTVFAYRLLIQGSIEDKIRQLQLYKSKLAKDFLGKENFTQALTLEDFRYLLS